MFLIIDRLGMQSIMLYWIPVGVFLYILLAQGAHLVGYYLPNMIYRNWLIEGLTFFAIGYQIRRHRNISDKFSDRFLAFIIIITTVLSPLEMLFMGREFGVNIVSFPQVIAIFLICLRHPDFGSGHLLTIIGQQYSMYIYVFHPAVWHFLDGFYSKTGIQGILFIRWIRPLICIGFTFIISFIFGLVLNNLRSIRKVR